MPCIEITGTGGRRIASGINGGFGSEMLDYCVVPILATLMAKDNVVSQHRGVATLCF
jgi:hypothetical protein